MLEQSNPFSKRTTNQDIEKADQQAMQQRDNMFKPQDKLFLNDMSNIMLVEEQLTQKSLDPANIVNQDNTTNILGTLQRQQVDP